LSLPLLQFKNPGLRCRSQKSTEPLSPQTCVSEGGCAGLPEPEKLKIDSDGANEKLWQELSKVWIFLFCPPIGACYQKYVLTPNAERLNPNLSTDARHL